MVFAAIIAACAVATGYAIYNARLFQQSVDLWHDYSGVPGQKGVLLSNLRDELGYGDDRYYKGAYQHDVYILIEIFLASYRG